MTLPKLLIATRNPGKMREYRQLLVAAPYELVSLEEVGVSDEVEETGLTFAENATLKANAYAALGGLLALADDSGLEVDALGGAPGVHSARYGEDSPTNPDWQTREQLPSTEAAIGKMSDEDRVDLLLHNLEGVPWERRTARFRCVICIATPPSQPSQGGVEGGSMQGRAEVDGPPCEAGAQGRLTLVVGSVAGMIQYEARGDEGFGYDPVFYLPSYGLTMGQLSLEEKNRISHRASAAGKAVNILKARN